MNWTKAIIELNDNQTQVRGSYINRLSVGGYHTCIS